MANLNYTPELSGTAHSLGTKTTTTADDNNKTTMQTRADLRELRDEVEEPTGIFQRADADRGVEPGAGSKGGRSHQPRKLPRESVRLVPYRPSYRTTTGLRAMTGNSSVDTAALSVIAFASAAAAPLV